MDINIGTPALLFPAISLLMLAYTNRFLGLAAVVRQLHQAYQKTGHIVYKQQISSLRERIRLIKNMQLHGVISLLLCTLCMFVLFQGWLLAGQIIFGASLVFMILSLFISLKEIHVSIHALDIQLNDISNKEEQCSTPGDE